eukprot:CAMPEP_0115550292 /NCGR_PEP_ID=MMETSP0271-20121206/95148_1 /TAXON_ID=71861 /ORGANISM="Scrippsiella trochoidea, Strain CCMP3099" /LENGTH=112 /DNA_ID=CAMNT_0002983873 /DNA_START=111 /DNA_END=450 /DNA_ORIENTATION=-
MLGQNGKTLLQLEESNGSFLACPCDSGASDGACAGTAIAAGADGATTIAVTVPGETKVEGGARCDTAKVDVGAVAGATAAAAETAASGSEVGTRGYRAHAGPRMRLCLTLRS